MAPRPPPSAALMDELVEEILLRIPPDDPASLLSAALVCKWWGRIVSDPGFRRRLAEFHGTPPMLGLHFSSGPWYSFATNTFVSTTSFQPSSVHLFVNTVDVRHGHVLLHGEIWSHERQLWDDYFKVWDPIAGDERATLPSLPLSRYPDDEYNLPPCDWNAAVLCASAADDTCDHLECHSGPFMVVFVVSGRRWGRSGMCAFVYSSEAAAWSQINAPHLIEDVQLVPSVLAGNSLYFLCSKNVLKFDLATREMSLIGLPQEIFGRPRPILRATTEGGLGLASMCSDGRLELWSREIGPDEDLVWAQSKVIKLKELLHAVVPDGPLGLPRLTGSAHGLDVVLVRTRVGIFTIHLKSLQVTKVCEDSRVGGFTFPYMRFCTPSTALGAAASAE